MSDNIDVTPGSGKTVAADNIGNVLHQRVKAGWGADGSYNDPSRAAPFPVDPTTPGAPTDRSVTITTGGTAQQAAASLATRRYLFLQNPSGSGGTLWFSTEATAVQASPSIELPPGASYESPPGFCPTGAISVIHPVTGAKITCREA